MWPQLPLGSCLQKHQLLQIHFPKVKHPHVATPNAMYTSTTFYLFITVEKFPWFEKFSPNYGWKLPGFPWLENVFKNLPDFSDRWKPWLFAICRIEYWAEMQQSTNLDKKGASFLLNVRSWLSSHSKKGNPSRFAKKESGSCKGGNINCRCQKL